MGSLRSLRWARRPTALGDLDEAAAAATAFRERFRGRLGELSAAELNDAVAELERLKRITKRVETFARLRLAADSSDQSRGALVQKVRERNTQIETELLFFDLEWAGLDDDVAERLLADPALERYASVLRSERRYRPYLLSEPEEKISAEKSLTGSSAWGRPLQRASLRPADRPRRDRSRSTRRSRGSRGDRAERAARRRGGRHRCAPAGGAHARLHPEHDLSERAIEDRLRGYPTWISARNLANEIPDEAADSLVEAIVARYDIPQRYYALKARLLGLPRMADYDRFAPLQEVPGTIAWEDARELVLESFAASRRPRATSSAASSSATGSTRRRGRGRCSARSARRSFPTSTPTC